MSELRARPSARVVALHGVRQALDQVWGDAYVLLNPQHLPSLVAALGDDDASVCTRVRTRTLCSSLHRV